MYYSYKLHNLLPFPDHLHLLHAKVTFDLCFFEFRAVSSAVDESSLESKAPSNSAAACSIEFPWAVSLVRLFFFLIRPVQSILNLSDRLIFPMDLPVDD